MTDVASMRAVLKGVDTLFLLNAVVPDETTQALGTLDLAREAGIQRIGHSRHGAAAGLLHAERPDVSRTT
jgi:uncharacterized protein YbjT (DUF2867 family)